jgi:hypothetical protein
VNPRQHLNEILATLGLPTLEFDRNGCARMLFEGQLVINFERDKITGLLHLYCDIGPLPLRGCESLYRALLEANLFGIQTRGATLAIDGKQNQVVLSRAVQIDAIELSAFSQILDSFVSCASEWQRFLAEETARVQPGHGLTRSTAHHADPSLSRSLQLSTSLDERSP